MGTNIISKIADFTIRAIMIAVTPLVLLFFAEKYNSFIFTFFAWVFLFALVVKGLVDATTKRSK